MQRIDRELEDVLVRRKELGVVDIKPHIDVTGVTSPHDFKRTMLNVLSKEEAILGGVCLTTADVDTVDELFE